MLNNYNVGFLMFAAFDMIAANARADFLSNSNCLAQLQA